jgi:hypothetical protein
MHTWPAATVPHTAEGTRTFVKFVMTPDTSDNALGGIKYKKPTIQNQSIIQKYFFSPMDSWRGKMKNQLVLKLVGFPKPVN